MSTYTFIILLTLIGFTALAALLLVPVYRFLKREEKASGKWGPERTFEAPESAANRPPSSNGVEAGRDAR